MPFKHGSKTSVYLDAVDLSPYLNLAEWNADWDAAETTTFNSTWKSNIYGTGGTKANFTGFYDPTQLKLETSLGVDFALTSGVLTVSQGGTVIGDDARLMSVMNASYTQSSPIGGVVGVKWAPATSAAIGFGWVLHPLAEDTNTTTGATYDGGAATATGWVAHLHVTAVDAGSWVVVLHDASASNFSDGAAVATFTAATAATAQRMVAATPTTALRRYIRYVATRTGGAGGDGITFQLSYSRNS